MKKVRITALSLILVFIVLCSSVFAVLVSDNDGSAFITKAEFDSLKNNFQSQLDQYNTSIDSKIDNAIANYLAGIKTETETEMKCLIDNNGVYGEKMKMSWNSSSTFRMISTTIPYPVHKYTYYVVITRLRFDTSTGMATDETSFESGIWDIPLLDRLGNEVSNYDAGTKKEYRVETVKIGSTDYRMLRFVKVKNYFNFVLMFGFPTTDTNAASPGSDVTGWDTGNFLSDNITKLTQKNLLAGQQVDYYRNHSTPASYITAQLPYTTVIKTGNAMITQDYEEDFEHVYAPFSTTQEYVWDPDSDVVFNVSGGSIANPAFYNTTGDVTWIGTVGPDNNPKNTLVDNIRVRPRYSDNYYFSWQHLLFKDGVKNEGGNDVQAKDAIIYNYYDIDKRNRAQKNGLILSTTPNKDDVEVVCECSSDVAGTVYFYVGDNPITNWIASDFAGKKYDLVAGADSVKCSLGKCENNKSIWVLFRPTSTGVNGKLKVKRLFYKNEN